MESVKKIIYKAENKSFLPLEFYSNPVCAGFPSPAEDHMDIELDLNEHLVKHPSATFYIYAKGDSMIDAGIYDGDIMIVDRSLDPGSKDVVIVIINGEFTVKHIFKKDGNIYLKPANKVYHPILVTEDMDFQIWGVVTHTIHSFK